MGSRTVIERGDPKSRFDLKSEPVRLVVPVLRATSDDRLEGVDELT